MLATVRRNVQAPSSKVKSDKSQSKTYRANQTDAPSQYQLHRYQLMQLSGESPDFANIKHTNSNSNNNNARQANFNTSEAFNYLKPENMNPRMQRQSQASQVAMREQRHLFHLGGDLGASLDHDEVSCPQMVPMMIDEDDEMDGKVHLIDGDHRDFDEASCVELDDRYHKLHSYHSLVSHLSHRQAQANSKSIHHAHQSLDCVDSLDLPSDVAIIERYLSQQHQYHGHPKSQLNRSTTSKSLVSSTTSQYPQAAPSNLYEHPDESAASNRRDYELMLSQTATRPSQLEKQTNQNPRNRRNFHNSSEDSSGSGKTLENYPYSSNFRFQSRPEFHLTPYTTVAWNQAQNQQLPQSKKPQLQTRSGVYSIGTSLEYPHLQQFQIGQTGDFLSSSRHQLLHDQSSGSDGATNYQRSARQQGMKGTGGGRQIVPSASDLPLGYPVGADDRLTSSQQRASSKRRRRRPSSDGGIKLGCCGSFAKLLLFVANVLFGSAGVALGGWGIWSLVEDHRYNLSQLLVFDHTSRMSLFQLISWSFITLGCASILIGFCGCSAMFKNNRWILGLYIFLILVIFALDLATGLLAIIFQERLITNVRLKLANKLRNDYGIQAPFTAAIDYVQTKFRCCGLDGHFDYDQSLWRLQRLGGFEATVARTCCQLRNSLEDQAHINPRPMNESMCQSSDVRFHQSYRYRKGCLDDLENLIRHKIWTFTVACGAVGVVILASLLFATCFCRSIPNQNGGGKSNLGQPRPTQTKKLHQQTPQIGHHKSDGAPTRHR